MIKLLKYNFSKKWPFLLFIVISGIIINFIILNNYNGIYYHEYRDYVYTVYIYVSNPPLTFVALYAGILATVLPVINFSFKMKKINVDLMYSLPIKRSKLYLSTLLFTIIEILITISVLFWQSFLDVLLSKHVYNLSYFVLYYFVLILLVLSLTCIVSFIFCRNNTIADGTINILLFSFAPLMVMQSVCSCFSRTSKLYYFFQGIYYFIYSPLIKVTDKFYSLIKGNDISTDFDNMLILIPTILFLLASIASVFGLIIFAKKEKGENSMQKSTSFFSYKVMVPLYIITGLILSVENIVIALGYVSVAGVGMYCFYNRTIKLHWKQWLLLLLYLVVGFVLALVIFNLDIGSRLVIINAVVN